MKPIGELENAYQIGYETPFNEIWQAWFTMPLDDSKNALCHHFNYVEVYDGEERIDLFRIMPTSTIKNANNQSITYTCEHVLGCLHDDGIDDYVQWSNYPTETVIEDMLSFQEEPRWQLGTVEISRFFHYGLEKEGLLGAVLSVPKPFDEPYQWTWDTTSYPWTLNLMKASDEVVGEAVWGHNIIGITKETDPYPMATRIYAYGYGEGVNQLNIEEVNPTGKRYVENSQARYNYGVIKYIWVDRRFEDAEMLYRTALAKLKSMSRIKTSYTADIVELKSLGDLNRYDVGKLIKIEDDDIGTTVQRVYNYRKPDVDRTFEITVNIGDKLDDLGTSQADMDRRQAINETYSQGATNIDSHSFADNCDPAHPAKIRFYLDDGLVNVNTMSLSYQIEPFRAYSKAIEGGGALVDSTESGGASTQTSSSGGGTTATSSSGGGTTATSSSGGGTSTSTQSGGGTSRSTNSGGGTTESSSAGGDHRHRMFSGQGFVENNLPGQSLRLTAANGRDIMVNSGSAGAVEYFTEGSSGTHSHSVSIPNHSHSFTVPSHSHDFSTPNHTHDVTVPNHTHDVSIPNHTHNVSIPAHTHEIKLPDHTHEIEHGIFVLNRQPSSVEIRVDGNLVESQTQTNGRDIDLIPFLEKDSSGKVTRNWHEITITPDDLGRVNADVISRLFIQSREGGLF